MSEPIGPGDWVECLRNFEASPNGPRLGGVYRVAKVHVGPFMRCEFGLSLEGMRSRSRHGFNGNGFRPIYRPKAGVFDSMLIVDKTKERVSA